MLSRDWQAKPERVVRNDHAKILATFPVQTNKHLLQNWPDTVLINCKKQTGLIIHIAVPRDENIPDKKLKKIQILVTKKARKTLESQIMVIPVIVGPPGEIVDRLPGCLC